MICPKCGGSGKVFCSMCKGTGLYHENDLITEQEYIQTCNTEQLAEVLWEKINGAFNSGYACCNLKQDKDYVGRYKRFKEWLKQPHGEE